MKREYYRKAAVVIVILLAAFFLIHTITRLEEASPAAGSLPTVRKIVIDPGHGGVDGGAVGYSGSIEKDLNLDISLKLRDLLTACGFEVVMTREDDRSIHDDSALSIREKKHSDLYNRLAIYNDDPMVLVVSVHLNQYGDSSVSGTQIYYSPNQPASKELAQSIQSAFVVQLQPENRRGIKPAENDLFLLFHAEVPAVLCECGFVSNPEEEAKLLDEEYRSKIAFSILTGIMDYLVS